MAAPQPPQRSSPVKRKPLCGEPPFSTGARLFMMSWTRMKFSSWTMASWLRVITH
ncbi:MAG: hypothetical protein HYZ19_03905 [Rhodocyclales bacterium]|nr:hypothetical protein [Rhodocyclales bacterium]